MEQFYRVLEVVIVMVPILLSVAYVTILERKVMASMQRRVGPNYVGYYGLLQPFADALKLLVKERVIPSHSNKLLFILGPMITLILGLLGWSVIPFSPATTILDAQLGLLIILAISSLGVYGILIAGWAANSKYAFLGALRSTAQMISYELVLSSIVLVVVFMSGSLNLTTIIENQKGIWNIFPLFPLFIIFIIGGLAETNRAPFDLPEAESELVAGFMTEHSAAIFVFFFLAEYSNIILISCLISILFLGGYLIPQPITYIFGLFNLYLESSSILTFVYSLLLGIKTCFIVYCFIWIRASFPRIRYDQLIYFCWAQILPIVFALIIFILSILFSFDLLTNNQLFN